MHGRAGAGGGKRRMRRNRRSEQTSKRANEDSKRGPRGSGVWPSGLDNGHLDSGHLAERPQIASQSWGGANKRFSTSQVQESSVCVGWRATSLGRSVLGNEIAGVCAGVRFNLLSVFSCCSSPGRSSSPVDLSFLLWLPGATSLAHH